MVLYTCERCGYETNKKTLYTNHLNRKRPCTQKTTPETNTQQQARPTSPTRSISPPPPKPLHVYKLLLKSRQQANISTTESNDDTYTGTIRCFGDETLAPLTDHLIGCLFLELDIIELILQLHYNPEYPENRNIRSTKSMVNTGGAKHTVVTHKVYTADGWQPRSIHDICAHLIPRVARIFKKYYANNYRTILERDMTEQELNEYSDTIERILDNDSALLNKYTLELQERLRTL